MSSRRLFLRRLDAGVVIRVWIKDWKLMDFSVEPSESKIRYWWIQGAKFFFSHLPGDSHGMSWEIMLIELSNLKLTVLAYSSHVIGHWMSHVKILLGASFGQDCFPCFFRGEDGGGCMTQKIISQLCVDVNFWHFFILMLNPAMFIASCVSGGQRRQKCSTSAKKPRG